MLRLLPHYLLGGLGAFFRRLRRGPRATTWGWGLEMLVAGQKRAMTHMARLEGRALRRVSDMKLPPSPAVRALVTEQIEAKTNHGPVRGRWIRAPRTETGTSDPAPRCVMMLHGGGYVVGSVDSHLDLAGRLAIAGGFDVFSVDYRLAPEHPHPAALDDARAAFQWLRTQGYAAQGIALVGDSAGAGLSTALLLDLRDAGAAPPAGAALICPWVDLTSSFASIQSNADTDYLTFEMASRWSRDYAGQHDREHPAISPLFADLHGLPPLLVHAGGAEILRDEIRAFAKKAQDAGTEVALREWDHMPHDFHLLGLVEPRGSEALLEVARFLRARLDGS